MGGNTVLLTALPIALAGAIGLGGCKGESEAPAGEVAQPASAAAGAPELGELERAEPIYCEGQEELTFEGIEIEAEEDAALVRGNCRVTITRSRLVGGAHGLAIEGTAQVTLRDSQVEGKRAAIRVEGRGTLDASGTWFSGRKIVGGKATFRDGGSNYWR
jgi:hypothetical protein